MPALVLVPLYLLAITSPLILSHVFGGPPRDFRQELASGLGIAAFAIILVEFVLSGRFRSVSRRIGMDVTMRFHQVMARTALAFALLHPLLYGGSPSGGARPWDPSRQLTLTTDFTALSTGILAYVLLPAFVVIAISRSRMDCGYETWRLMHGIGALVIAAALLHHTLSAGRYAAEPGMAWLWAGMAGIAGGSLLYVYVIVPLRKRARPWRVDSVRRLSPAQWELTIAPRGHRGLDFEAGQFVWLSVGRSPFSLWENPFSISSAPSGGPGLSFVIKERGDFTGSLGRIAPGTAAHVDGPFGSLTLAGQAAPGVVLIAGGVGIAPLLSVLRDMRLTGDPRPVRVIYGNRAEEQILYRAELEQGDVIHVLSEPPPGWQGETGVIDAGLLERVLTEDQLRDWLFLICGPQPMIDGVEDHLAARGTPPRRILSERFEYD